MLKLNSTSTGKNKHLVRGLLFGGALLILAQTAPASPVVNSFSYSFRAAMTNVGVDADALGTVSGNLTRRGVTDRQRLTISASKLDADSTYHVVAVTGDNVAATAAVDFVTNRRGGSTITYVKNNGRHPLPAVLDPISNVRELDILNAGSSAVLRADLLDPDAFSYAVRREMENTGFMAGADGVLQLRGTPRLDRKSTRLNSSHG